MANNSIMYYKNEIGKFLSELKNTIINEKSINKQDEIHNLENYVMGIFNIIYDMNGVGRYINLNAKQANTPGVDLFSELHKRYVQVTVSATNTKLKDSLNKTLNYFNQNNINGLEYEFLFFSIDKIKNLNIPQEVESQFKKIETMTLSDLQRQIDAIDDLDKLIKIYYNYCYKNYQVDLPTLDIIIQELCKNGIKKETAILPKKYGIEDKIEYNKFNLYVKEIQDYIGRSDHVAQVINIHEKKADYEVKEELITVVSNEYKNIKLNNDAYSNDKVFHELIQELVEKAKIKQIGQEGVLRYITCIVVYVFCECRIFDAPEERR